MMDNNQKQRELIENSCAFYDSQVWAILRAVRILASKFEIFQKLGWGKPDILVISYGLISDVVGGDQGSCKCLNLSSLNFHNYSI